MGAQGQAVTDISTERSALTVSSEVLTQHGDNQRTGQTLETTLTPANVSGGAFGPRFKRTVDGQIYAQLLYASAVPGTRLGTKNLLIAATMNNTVYAFDADNTSVDPATAPVWSSQVMSPAPTPGGAEFLNGTSTIGIMATPVIDKQAGRIYLVAATGDRQFKLVSLALATGALVGQQTIGPNTAGFNNNGRAYVNRAGLLLSNGRVFVAFASYRDGDGQFVYNGFIFSYPAADIGNPAAETVYCTTCGNSTRTGGAIWQSGSGLVADEAGMNLYFMTGNGMPYQSVTQPEGHEDSFVMLPAATLAYSGATAWYPPDFGAIEVNDLDLGSGGPLLVPNNGPVIGGGKTGVFYVFNRALMPLQCFQAFDNENIAPLMVNSMSRGAITCPTTYDSTSNARDNPPNIHGNPVYYKAADDGVARVYAWSEKSRLKAWPIVTDSSNNQVLGSTPVQSSVVSPAIIMPGGALSVSGNPAVARTGIVWATLPEIQSSQCPLAGTPCDANRNVVPGHLYAFDAVTLNLLYYETIRKYAKFTPPTVANGRVYVPTFANEILVFGLRQAYAAHFDTLAGDTVQTNARPAVLASGASLDVFIRGSDNSLKHKLWNGTSWSPSASYDPLGGVITSNPAAVTTDVFARDLSNGISFKAAPAWSTWGPSSGGAIQGDPTPVIATSGRVDVVGQASDATLAHTFLDSAWHPWVTSSSQPALGRAMTSGTKPFALSLATGQLDVFARNDNQHLLHYHYSGSTWTSEELLAGLIISDPVAVSSAPNRIDVFALGVDYQLAHIFCSPCTVPATWSAWEADPFWGMVVSRTSLPQSRPAVLSTGTNQMDVFVEAGNTLLQHMAYVNGSWMWWETLGGSLTSEPTAVKTTQGIQVLVRQLDGTLGRTSHPGGILP